MPTPTATKSNPNLTDKMVEFNKTLASTSFTQARNVACVVLDGVSAATKAARDAGATVVGQARAVVERTVDSADTGTAEVRGQAQSAARRTADTAGAAAKQAAGQARSATKRTADTASAAAKQVAGQARAAAKNTGDTAVEGAKEVRGQVLAQGERAADQIDDAANQAVDRAIDVVDDSPAPGTPYEQWTKEQLYNRAQELDIDGRSSMSKSQLVKALRS